MDIFSNKEVIPVDSMRTATFFIQTDSDFVELAKKVVLSVVKDLEMFKLLNNANFVLQDQFKGKLNTMDDIRSQITQFRERTEGFRYGFVKKKGLLKTMTALYINVDSLALHAFENGGDSSIKFAEAYTVRLTRTVEHEVTHLWQYEISDETVAADKAEERLTFILNKHLPEEFKLKFIEEQEVKSNKFKGGQDIRAFIAKTIASNRMNLLDFLINLQKEGLARFVDMRLKLKLSKNVSTQLHVNALKSLKRGLALLDVYLDKMRDSTSFKEFVDNLSKANESIIGAQKEGLFYYIGLHMVYELYASGLSLEEIAKLSYIRFIKKYEEIMLERNSKIMVSYSSGKGVFDYNRVIKSWSSGANHFLKTYR